MVDPLLAGDRAPAPRTLVDVLADVTARHPDAPALDDTRTVLTYTELTERARHLAVELAAAGVCRGDRVGVRAPSGTADLYVAVLGILRAGAAYVPVDVDDPPERADLVFSEAGVTAVVGDASADHRAGGRPGLAARRGPASRGGSRRYAPTTTRGSSSRRARPACPRAWP